jgi:phosphopantothenoylcysteine decarboxylase/phosphopantothenate--cysteine ligase
MKDRAVDKKSQALEGKRIAYVLCGSIGAVEAVRAIRELRRHGARVVAFPTASALRFVTAEALAWASEGPVIVELGPQVEYLDPFDGVVVAPLTLNSLAKIALGLGDGPAPLVVATALGNRLPVLCVPTMHAAMREHPCYGEYRARLEGWGVAFLESEESEGRQKMPPPERIAEATIACLTKRPNSISR